MIESTQITKHHNNNQKNQQSLIDFIGQWTSRKNKPYHIYKNCIDDGMKYNRDEYWTTVGN